MAQKQGNQVQDTILWYSKAKTGCFLNKNCIKNFLALLLFILEPKPFL
jgi:hypothetical protein